MPERGLGERQELHPDSGRIGVRRQREVRPAQRRRRADGREQVLDQGQVEHLLLGDVDELAAPAPDRLELGRGQALVVAVLHRKRRVQVLAHHELLERGRLAERVDERLAVLEDHRRRAGRDTTAG